MTRWCLAVGIFAATFLAPAVSAQIIPVPTLSIPQASLDESFSWQLSTGFDYTTGKYGAHCALQSVALICTPSSTTVIDIPATAMVQIDRLRLQVTVPYVDIVGPGKFAGVLGIPIIVAPANNVVKQRSGLGDISVGGAWIVSREEAFWPTLEIAGVVKLPTAASGLGTGKTDYGAQVNLYHALLPGLTAFGSLGYQWIGDIGTVHLVSGGRATAGLDFKFAGNALGAALDYRQPSWQGGPDYLALEPYFKLDVIGVVGFSVYGIVGLTRSSPSQGAGLRIML